MLECLGLSKFQAHFMKTGNCDRMKLLEKATAGNEVYCMNQSERRQYLIRSLCDERAQYRRMEIPSGKKEQDDLLRALMNVREPEKISEEFLKIQDAYLQEEQSKRVLIDVSGSLRFL